MKILFLIQTLSLRGGAENALINLVLNLKDKGHEAQIIFLQQPNDFIHSLQKAGIKAHSVNLKSRLNFFSGFIRITRIIRDEKPDILNAINFIPMLYLAITKVISSRVVRIVSYHNMGYEAYPANTNYRKIRKYFDIFCNQFMDGHTGVSQAVANSYKNHLMLKEIQTINNIIPVERILASFSSSREIANKKNSLHKIIMAGRLVPEKGYDFMISAMRLLVDRGLKVKLEIHGDGLLKDELNEQIAACNLNNHIFIHATVSHSQLFQKIFLSDILVLSSISEGLPMAAAEAMVIGTPVIATKVGGLPEMIQNNVSGILFEPKDSIALADAIEVVLGDKELQDKLSSGGRSRISEKYSAEKVSDDLLNYFRKLLHRKGVS